jgi:archaeosine-15-forming tRNA-guanine transglycosylase
MRNEILKVIFEQTEVQYGIPVPKNFEEVKIDLNEKNREHVRATLHDAHCLICGSSNDDCFCEDK